MIQLEDHARRSNKIGTQSKVIDLGYVCSCKQHETVETQDKTPQVQLHIG